MHFGHFSNLGTCAILESARRYGGMKNEILLSGNYKVNIASIRVLQNSKGEKLTVYTGDLVEIVLEDQRTFLWDS